MVGIDIMKDQVKPGNIAHQHRNVQAFQVEVDREFPIYGDLFRNKMVDIFYQIIGNISLVLNLNDMGIWY